MPEQFIFTEPEEVTCMKVSIPVVLAEEEVQVLIDSTLHMPELTKKVDHIDARVDDLEVEPVFIHEHIAHWHVKIKKEWAHHFKEMAGLTSVVKKLIVEGTLHKQIYYVNQRDEVKHVQEEVPFTKMIELKEAQPVLDEDNVFIQMHKPRLDVSWELVRAGRLQQTGIIILRVKVVEYRQIFVQVCPSPELCPPGNFLEDPSFEHWAGNIPVFWGATNVTSTGIAHTGSLAADLGRIDPTKVAALFQTTRRNIAGGRTYKLIFWVRENLAQAPLSAFSNFNLMAEVRFFNGQGIQIDGASQTWPHTGIPDNRYEQFSFNVTAPAGAGIVLVRFSFMPGTGNNGTVKIDDVTLECIGGI
jgi:hypothetical protein